VLLYNTGDDKWPPGCNLRYCTGDNLSNTDRAIVEALLPGQVTDVSVEMHSPANTGVYQSQWRLSTPTGLFFGGQNSDAFIETRVLLRFNVSCTKLKHSCSEICLYMYICNVQPMYLEIEIIALILTLVWTLQHGTCTLLLTAFILSFLVHHFWYGAQFKEILKNKVSFYDIYQDIDLHCVCKGSNSEKPKGHAAKSYVY
jgi:hypothetical protein